MAFPPRAWLAIDLPTDLVVRAKCQKQTTFACKISSCVAGVAPEPTQAVSRLLNPKLRSTLKRGICPPMKAIVNLSGEEMLKARYNQPRVSLEQLRQQEEQHRRASEEFFKAARNATSKSGRAKTIAG